LGNHRMAQRGCPWIHITLLGSSRKSWMTSLGSSDIPASPMSTMHPYPFASSKFLSKLPSTSFAIVPRSSRARYVSTWNGWAQSFGRHESQVIWNSNFLES
jgi:hypothetical protein